MDLFEQRAKWWLCGVREWFRDKRRRVVCAYQAVWCSFGSHEYGRPRWGRQYEWRLRRKGEEPIFFKNIVMHENFQCRWCEASKRERITNISEKLQIEYEQYDQIVFGGQ